MAAYLWDGKPLIVDGKVAVHEDCCCPFNPCPTCITGTTPIIMPVQLSGAAFMDPLECEECEELNTIFYLSFSPMNPEVPDCRWRLYFIDICANYLGGGNPDPGDPSYYYELTVFIRAVDMGGGVWNTLVSAYLLQAYGGCSLAYFGKTYEGVNQIDCTQKMVLTQNAGGSASCCDLSNMGCILNP